MCTGACDRLQCDVMYSIGRIAYWSNPMQKRALKMMGASDEIGHQQVTSALLGLIIDAGKWVRTRVP